MSTKINVRSPFYVSFSEPVRPLPLFSCSYANPQNFQVDESGVISEPILDFGTIKSFTSTASDFSDGKFAEVSTNTVRTVVFTIEAPEDFSNAGESIQCSVDATQVAKPVSCPAVVSPSSTISNQALNVGGNSVDIVYSSKFTGTTSDFKDIVRNIHQEYLDTSINETTDTLTITSKNTAGTFDIYIERIDNSTGCNAAQKVTVVVSATAAFDCTAANLLGGNVAADGTLTTPSALGNITATKETSGGASVTSIAANNTGSDISVTLFYDVTAPSGYTNSGSTIECSKTFTQRSNTVVPTFTCNDVDLDDQAILVDGSVTAGVAKWFQAPLGKSDPEYFLTINSFTPTKFDAVATNTNRDVDYTITVPTGFTNTGSTIVCTETLKQPAADIPADPCSGKIFDFYVGVYIFADLGNLGYPLTEFRLKNHGAVNWNVKARVSSIEDLKGEVLCNATGGIYQARAGNHVFISTLRFPPLTNIEFALVFGANNTIAEVYRKDWNNKTVTPIG